MLESQETYEALRLRGILEAAIYVDDLAAAEAFYRDVLGLVLLQREAGRHLFFRCGQQMLLIFNPMTTARELDTPHGTHGAGHVAFAVALSELEKWKTHLLRMSIQIEKDFHWPNGARSLYFRDPAGNSVELASPRLWNISESHFALETEPGTSRT